MARHVVLLGLMGAGKTSIGRRVAARLGVELVDGDERLADRTGGRTAAVIADDEGIDALHAMELDIGLAALASPTPAVIGPAASVCESAEFRARLAGCAVVWLTAPLDHLARKAVKKRHRPLVRDGDVRELLAGQLAVREPLILALDPLVVDVSTIDDDDAADLVVAFAWRLLATGGPPVGYRSVTPRIVVDDVAGVVAFLDAVFLTTSDVEPGRPAEVRVGDSLVMVSSSDARDTFPAFLYVYVDDADAAFGRAVAGGATVLEEPLDTPYGDRRAMVRDPFGNVLQIAHRLLSR